MPLESRAASHLEIGHILFMDVVGYSKLLSDEQRKLFQLLNDVVRNTSQFRSADAAGKLVRLPTGDGMVLAFFTSVDAPVRCAQQISRELRSHPELKLRMGINSGPVDAVSDVNDRPNITGAGINLAQRVMDVGDAGHVLLSKRVADDLAQYSEWNAYLHDLGELEVKHGVRVPIINFYADGVGNAQPPLKIQRAAEERAHAAAAAKQHQRKRVVLTTCAAILLLAFIAIGTWVWQRRVALASAYKVGAAGIVEKSIAVLPFEYFGGDKDNAYLADGVQDDILTDLAKVADLKVISRRSVAQYRGSTQSIRDIGRTLQVAYVLEGTVRKAAGKVRVTAQLIDTRSAAEKWAEKYDRDFADIFAIQNEISETIADQLKAVLTPEEKATIEMAPTKDMEAYDLYLRAKKLLHSTDALTDAKGEDNYRAAVDLLNKAVGRDPNFALAYCLLADINTNLYRFSDSSAYIAAAETAMAAAKRIAPQAGETHLARAIYFYFGHFDFDHALEELEKAAQSLPNNLDVALISARVERRLGRWTESARHFVRAAELDPRDFSIRSEVARTYGMMRRYDDAIRADDQAIADFPERADIFRQQKAGLAVDKGDLKLARATLDQMPAGQSATVMTMLQRFNIAMLMRDFNEANRAVAARAKFPHREFLAPDAYFSAQVAWARGDKEKARSLSLQAKQELEARLQQYPQHESAGFWLEDLAETYAALGLRDEALRTTEQALRSKLATEDPLQRPGFLESRAIVYCQLGERDRTLQQLEELAKMPNGTSYGSLCYDPHWDPLRGDPRFEKIVANAAQPIKID